MKSFIEYLKLCLKEVRVEIAAIMCAFLVLIATTIIKLFDFSRQEFRYTLICWVFTISLCSVIGLIIYVLISAPYKVWKKNKI